jgi:Spy/CpxP family protein refolding chaperone
MTKARKLGALLFATAALATAAAPAFATPSPPTNGGNGGGKSGQCTGSAQERPGNACQSGNK